MVFAQCRKSPSFHSILERFVENFPYFSMGTHFKHLCKQNIRYLEQKYATGDTPFVSASHFLVDGCVGETKDGVYRGDRLRQARIAT